MAREPLPPADKRFATCSEAADIATALMKEYPLKFGDLATAQILFLTQIGGIKYQGERKAGKMERVTGQKKFLSRSPENGDEGWDYIMTLCADVWARADAQLKKRIVFHELRHAMREEKDDGSFNWKIIGHEIETFHDEVEIFGSGRDLSEIFYALAEETAQEKGKV